jgi:hypothetical protein
MLREAQGLIAERDDRDLVCPTRLKRWKDAKTFQATTTTPERIQIDGHVDGGDAKNRADQEALLNNKGLPQANIEDSAAAFVAFYVATGKDLFEDKVVRAAGGALFFLSNGLNVHAVDVDDSNGDVAVASRVPWNRKN